MPKPTKLRRRDGFLGIHFDFHASSECDQVGRTVTRRMIREVIETVRPDFIQCDCKGHAGYCSYPTKVGNPASRIVRDQLRIWREVTREMGVSLIMHYSGVWDQQALAHHPQWAVVDADGKPSTKMTSVFGPYVDELLVPQLTELRREYGVDGAWVDGECWATERDYSEMAARAFMEKTGRKKLPRPGDADYALFTEFCREGFRAYLRHYIQAMRAIDPEMEITSNWAFSSFMPEPVSIDLPFLSGDYSLADSVNTARWEARCLAQQQKPWDLMAWGFGGRFEDPCRSTKSVEQLQQEASTVLALGGGFQVYYKQNFDGSVQSWQMKIMGEVAKFCRQRQAACHRAQTIAQIGLHYSSSCYYKTAQSLFAPGNGEGSVLSPIRGVLQCLLDGQATVDVLMDHHMRDRMDEYPLLILPEWESIDDDLRDRYIRYVRNGGSLLVIGPRPAMLFADELGITPTSEIESKPRWVEHDGRLAGVLSAGIDVKLKRGARQFGVLRPRNDMTGPTSPAGSIRRLGKGLIAGIYIDIGARYRKLATAGVRCYLQAICRELFPRPMIEVAGSEFVDVALMRKDGRMYAHLINLAGPHANLQVAQFDHVPPVGPLTVTLRPGKRPKRIIDPVTRKRLPFTWRNDAATLTLERLHIHQILAVE